MRERQKEIRRRRHRRAKRLRRKIKEYRSKHPKTTSAAAPALGKE